jgi:GNAT superfamily N-acetyltransferase
MIHDGGDAELRTLLPAVTELYLATRAEPPYDSKPLYHRDSFLDRTQRQMEREGFRFCWATDTFGVLVGFAFGLPSAIERWWSKPLPPNAAGQQVFAVIEVNVAKDHRGQGLARKLLQRLLDNRPEPYAALTSTPEAPARQMYDYLGWMHVGTIQFTDGGDWFDQMAIALPLNP